MINISEKLIQLPLTIEYMGISFKLHIGHNDNNDEDFDRRYLTFSYKINDYDGNPNALFHCTIFPFVKWENPFKLSMGRGRLCNYLYEQCGISNDQELGQAIDEFIDWAKKTSC